MKNISLKNDLSPLLRIAIPLALTGIMQSGVFFFETLFLAHVSEKTLAAGALVSWLFGILAVILFGTLSAINILIALKHGANDQKNMVLVARDGFWLAIILTVPAFILFWNMSPIFLLFKQPESIVLLAQSYLHALAWGLLPNFIMIAILEVIIGIGHARIIMIFSFISVSLNIFCSYVLIFGKFGFPALGISGAGWGMTLSYWMSVILLVMYVLFHKTYKKYFSQILTFHKPYFLWELLRVGVPMGMMYCVEVAFFFALTLMMGSLSSKILAANQIVLQYLGILMSTMFALAQAVTVRMGHLLGAKENPAAKRANYMGMMIATLLMLMVAIVFWFFPKALIAIDLNTHNPKNFAIIKYIEQFFILSAIFQIFEAVRICLFGALRALKDTNFTLLTSIISFWGVAFPIGYLLAIHFHLGGSGFWLAMIISAIISVILLISRFQLKMKNYSAII